ncbi:MAG: alpha/beta hydrolase [Actinobacteria bacterium]|nr:alpha/beta hydrolase [Actinomycetota bacterium]
MTVALLHGNPETDAIWTDLVGELADRGAADLVLLSPPGFGAPVPDGWGATRIEYRDWLVTRLEEVVVGSGPVDLVAHDWGAGHVFGLLAIRSDLVRSWACDCTGLLHPDYEWHDLAQLWQTPDVGEQVVDGMRAMSRDDWIAQMAGQGMGGSAAAGMADSFETMAGCILPLYRSGAQPVMADLGAVLAASELPPGLALDPTGDPFVGPVGRAAEVARMLGAGHAPMDGAGHWWMMERPAEAAALLMEFWASR